MMRTVAAVLALLLCSDLELSAQVVLTGVVREDGSGRPLSGVDVRVEGTKLTTTTNDSGRFVLSGLAKGWRVALFRSVGYQAVRMRMLVGQRDTMQSDVTLVPSVPQLDSLVVTERPSLRGAGLRESFEERRRLGKGRFIDSTELRRSEHVRTSDVLRRNGVYMQDFVEPECYVGGRPAGGCRRELRAASARGAGVAGQCWMGVMLNGSIILYASVPAGAPGRGKPPDFRTEFEVSSLEAIEVYRSGAEVPLEFNAAGASCGLIVLWTRRK